MKYFKKYTTFVNEKSEFGFNLFDIFKPFVKIISSVSMGIKMNNIITDYDNYLYDVYIEYIKQKGNTIEIPKQKFVKEYEISDGGDEENNDDDVNVESDTNINSSDEETPLVNDLDNEEASSDNSTIDDEEYIKPSNSDTIDIDHEDVSNVKKINHNKQILQLNPSKEIDSDTKKDIKNNSLNKKNTNDIINKNVNRRTRSVNKATIDKFVKDMVYYVDNSKSYDLDIIYDNYVKELEYNKSSLEKNKTALTTAKISLNTANRKMSSVLAKNGDEYKNAKKKYLEMSDKVSNLNLIINKSKSDVERCTWYMDEINKIFNLIDKNDSIKESVDWSGNAVHDPNWTSIDMDNINKLVNPFQIEEFHLRSEVILSKVDDKNKEKAKLKWSKLINSLYKKWYYIFDVKNLKNITPKFGKNTTEDLKNKEGLAYTATVLEEMFHNVKSYAYRFKMLYLDKNKNFILVSKTNMILMKSISLTDNNCCFQVLSILKVTEDGERIYPVKYLNNSDNKVKINLNEQNINLYKAVSEYPIIFINDGYLYTTEKFKDFEKISLVNCGVYSLKDYHFKKIIKNTNASYVEKMPSEDIFNLIKKTKL